MQNITMSLVLVTEPGVTVNFSSGVMRALFNFVNFTCI